MIQKTERQQQIIDAIEQILAVYECGYRRCTIDERFENCPEGDFNWDGGDYGLSHACWDGDAEEWHSMTYREAMGRENGNRWVQVFSRDGEGNIDIEFYWKEPDHSPDQFEIDYPLDLISGSEEYYLHWARYYSNCADSGEDPLGVIDDENDAVWVENRIKQSLLRMQKLESDRLIKAFQLSRVDAELKGWIAMHTALSLEESGSGTLMLEEAEKVEPNIEKL